VLVAVALAVTVLAGCAGQKEPGSYTGGVKDDFKQACYVQRVLDAEPTIQVGSAASMNDKEAKVKKDAPKAVIKAASDYCSCVLKVILKKVHFSEFKKVNDDLRDDNNKPLPSSFTKAFSSCKDTTATVATKQ
jgi:hypothetical protein